MRRESATRARGRGPMRRETTAAAILALVMALLMTLATGCAGLSAVGPVGEEKSEPRADPLSRPYTRVLARGPIEGMSEEGIVQGFIAAMADFSGDHAVAKQYLTQEARENWDPQQAGVVVYKSDSDRVPTERDTQDPAESRKRSEGKLYVNLDPIAEIRDDGRYSARTEQTQFSFHLAKVKGEWRIAEFSPNLLLRSSDVARTYRKVDLHFLGPDGLRLVPDPVYIPVIGTDLPTAMVRRLGRGPTTSLEKAVKPALFEEAAVQSVVTDGNRLTVVLGGSARPKLRTGAARSALVAQLVYTLGPLPGIDLIRVRIGDQDVTLDGRHWFRREDPAVKAFSPAGLSENTDGYLVRDGRLHRVDPGNERVTPVEGPAGSGDLRLRAPAISHDQKKVAGLTDQGTVTVAGISKDSAAKVWLKGGNLTAPSWGPGGKLWMVDRSGLGTSKVTSRVYRTDGQDREELELPPALANSEIDKLRVSRDGSRVLIVSKQEDRWVAYVAAVTPVEIDVPQEVAPVRSDQQVLDAAWLDGTHVVLLTEGKNEGGLDLIKAAIAGPEAEGVTSGGIPPHAESVAAAPGEDRVLLGAAGDRVYRLKTDTWQTVEGGGSDPVFPG